MSDPVNFGPYVLEMPESYDYIDNEQVRELTSRFNEGLKAGLIVAPPGCKITRLNVAPSEAQMGRLLALLSLTDEERAFVRAALEPDAGRDFFAVLADYLEERGSPEAARYRAAATG